MNDDETKPTFFVSRRGRQVGMHEVDLQGIDIESNEAVAPVKRPNAPPRERSSRVSLSNKRPFWTKKKITIIAIVALILAVPFVGAELVTAQYRTGVTNAEHDLAMVVKNTVLPSQKKATMSADQVRNIAGEVNEIVGHMCRGGLLDNAAGLYPRASTALHECKTMQGSYASLANSLYTLEGQARYLERVDAVLKSAATPITDEYAVIGSQQTVWQKAALELKKVSPPESMNAAHSELLAHVNGVAEGWSSLNTANNAHDAAGFEAAEKVLSTEYEAVRTSGSAFTVVLAGTQATIMKNYSLLK